MRQHFRAAISQLLIWTLIASIIYPGFVTGAAQLLFSHRANGTVIRDRNDQIIGSELISQSFNSANYFWGRPSATAPHPYNAAASSGSNLGPTNTALADAVKQRIALLQAADPENRAPVPVDLVTASSSGLDPHISPAAAEYQAARVAKYRSMDISAVQQLIAQHTEGRQWRIFGEPRVNVLLLNRAVDDLQHRLGVKNAH